MQRKLTDFGRLVVILVIVLLVSLWSILTSGCADDAHSDPCGGTEEIRTCPTEGDWRVTGYLCEEFHCTAFAPGSGEVTCYSPTCPSDQHLVTDGRSVKCAP